MPLPSDCAVGAKNSQAIADHGNRLDKIDLILEKVRNRPPVWATVAIAFLTGLCGWLIQLQK